MLSVFKFYRFLFGLMLPAFVVKSSNVSFLDLKNKRNFVGLSGLTVFLNLLLLLTGSVAAQNTITGAFQGTVSSSLGGAIAGAAVRITNEKTGVFYDLVSDDKGQFFQGLLPPGVYIIRVETANFKARELRRPLNISKTGEVVPVPVTLEPATSGATATAVVPEEANDIRIEINTTDARRDGSFKDEVITKLPLGATTITRSFDELALLLPGVAPPPQTIGDVAGPGVGPGVGSAGQFAVNGLRSRANNFTVDGSDNNDEDIGVRRQGFVALIPQPIESIQEYQVITLLAPAQFGRNLGAQVNAVSKQGENKINGSLYGFFNSSQLNARNFFDTTNGSDTFALRSATGQEVLLDGNPLTVRNQSGGENSFTFGQAGATLGGAIVPNRLFYFVSGEFQKINATQEKSFAVPNIEQRGAFGTGATGIFESLPFDSTPLIRPAIPTNTRSAAIFSLYPFPNNPSGVYGANTFTKVLPASGRGVILSGRFDENFNFGNKQQSVTARYNFTDDNKNIPAVNDAVFSTVRAKIRTQNLSLFYNSQLKWTSLFNQVRFSVGRTHLEFDEIRDEEFLIKSESISSVPFLLNAPLKFNITQSNTVGQRYTGPVLYTSAFAPINPLGTRQTTVEQILGPIGQIHIAGFSAVGVDVYNFPQNRVNNTYQIADELIWRSNSHNIVFGTDIRRTDLISDLPRLSRPLITFNGAPRLILENNSLRLPTINDPFPILKPEDLVSLGTASNSLLTFNIDRPDVKNNLRFYQFNFYGQDTWRINSEWSLSYGLRYEYNSPVHEVDNLIEQTFSDSRLSLAGGLDRFIGGRSALYEPDKNNFAPRVGIAYSKNLFGGNRVSVFRAGYGIFYDQILGAVVNQSQNVFPTYLTVNYGGVNSGGVDPSTTNVRLFIGNPGRDSIDGVPIQLPGSVNLFNSTIGLDNYLRVLRNTFPNAITATLPAKQLPMPMAHHYSFGFEQQLNPHFVVSINYVGTSGQNLLRFSTPNLGSSLTVAPTSLQIFPPILIDSGIGCDPVTRTGPGCRSINMPNSFGRIFAPDRAINTLGAVNLFETTASSNYNSLQAQLRGRFINSLNFQLAYTYSKVTDDVSDVFDLAGAYALPQDSLDLKSERGPANFDLRHRFTYDLIYTFPKSEEINGFLRFLTGNLQIASLGRFHTGQPFTVNSIIDVNLDGNLTDRLNTTQGIEVTRDRSQPLLLTTNNTISLLAPFGQNGQVGRNSFRAGNVLELDLSIIKPFVFGTNRLNFRTDIFNFINRANFGIPVRLLEAPGFGKAVNTITPGRRIQFSLKYEF